MGDSGSLKSSGAKEQRIESPAEPSTDYGAMYNAMNQMAELTAMQNANSMNAMMALQSQAPVAEVTPNVDWKKRADALREKIGAEEKEKALSRKGRESTILTSPLTDEKVKVTESVLTGK